MNNKEIYINYNGYACPLSSMPCGKNCNYRYAIVCPQCKWGAEHSNVNTYASMTEEEVKNSKGIKLFKDILREEREK